MEKLAMREYLAELETRIDLALKKWKKESRIENGRVVHLDWQFEQAHVLINVFWHDNAERVVAYCIYPDDEKRKEWDGLTPNTLIGLCDCVRNFASWSENRLH